ncbi:MAG TPA: antibiotic biosynthesis monooxygenase family protein [Actinoplanes sp.]|jgi:quinol monooxygenase YgiN
MSGHDGALFLVVTIRPRPDRLAEAEAQLQSMRRNSLTEPGCVFMHLVQPQDDPATG